MSNLTINTNLSSQITQRNLSKSTSSLNTAIERMSTGAKINHAKDNAAGYSIATNLNVKMSSYDVASDNIASGMDLVTTAMDTISLMQNNASRLKDLWTQANNGTYGAQSIQAMNQEATSIVNNLVMMYNNAEYNGISLFNNKAYDIPDDMPKAGASGFIDESFTPVDTSAMTKLSEVSLSSIKGGTWAISSVEDLQKLAEITNQTTDYTTGTTFVLSDDIDLSGISNWTPIGDYSTNSSYSFKGTFNGNGHTISNLKIDNPAKNYQGLFGYTVSGSTIKNLGLKNVDVKGRNYVGGLVGYSSSSSSITNCYVTGNVSGNNYVGGLVGYSFSTITNCYATGNVSGNNFVGGLSGVFCDSLLENSYAFGDVSGTNSVGGLSGLIAENLVRPVVNNCISSSEHVVGSSKAGSFAGAVYSATITNCQGVTIAGLNVIGDGDKSQASNIKEVQKKDVTTTLQVGVNGDSSSQISFDTNFALDLSAITANGIKSQQAYDTINAFLETLNTKSTELGSAQNRLDSALESTLVQIENLTSSHSTIKDADIAEVSSEYIKQQILQQAASTLLATANQQPSIALALI